MDIYGEDNVISSDEYDESDDLLNVAVSSSNLKVEPQKSTINQTVKKPEKKLIRALGLRLKKKSIKWMQHKFKRNQIRNRYLYSIERAKCIDRRYNSGANTSAGHKELAIEVEPKQEAIITEKKKLIDEAVKAPQHETIDLDDSDDEDDDEVDDFDEEDDDESNSSNSSNDEEEDIEEINNVEDDYMDEVNNEAVVGHMDDGDEDVNKIHNDVKHDINDKNNEIPKSIVPTQIVESKPNNFKKITEEPIEENIPKSAAEPLITAPPIYNNTPTIQVLNSTTKEEQEQQSQKDDEVLAIASPKEIQLPTFAENINSLAIPEKCPHSTLLEDDKVIDTQTPLKASIEDLHCNMNKAKSNSRTTGVSNNVEIMDVSKDLGIEQSFFFNDELNAMYPNFDKIVNEHVTFPETAEIIKQRIKLIAADVEHINKALEIKEKECNQLLYVKHTKEQILARLLRKIKRNEVNTDKSTIKALADRELGIVPKQTRPKEPPSKRRKLEPRTAQEILQQTVNMSLDEVLRAKAHNNLDANFIDDTLKRFGITSFSQDDKIDKIKQNLNKSKNKHKEFFDTSINLSVPEKRAYQQISGIRNFDSRIYQQQTASTERGQNLLLNLLNNDNDSDDAASISYVNKNIEQQSILEHIPDNWPVQKQQQKMHNSNYKEEDDTYEVIIENRVPVKANDVFPILNKSKRTSRNSDETLVVHLNNSAFKDNFKCQYCGIHKAQYVCAECENQWYCSRSCQVKAWDSHCETCA